MKINFGLVKKVLSGFVSRTMQGLSGAVKSCIIGTQKEMKSFEGVNRTGNISTTKNLTVS